MDKGIFVNLFEYVTMQFKLIPSYINLQSGGIMKAKQRRISHREPALRHTAR